MPAPWSPAAASAPGSSRQNRASAAGYNAAAARQPACHRVAAGTKYRPDLCGAARRTSHPARRADRRILRGYAKAQVALRDGLLVSLRHGLAAWVAGALWCSSSRTTAGMTCHPHWRGGGNRFPSPRALGPPGPADGRPAASPGITDPRSSTWRPAVTRPSAGALPPSPARSHSLQQAVRHRPRPYPLPPGVLPRDQLGNRALPGVTGQQTSPLQATTPTGRRPMGAGESAARPRDGRG